MQLRTTALAASLLIALAGLSACSGTATLEPASNERAASRSDANAQAPAPAVTQSAAAQAAAAAYDF